MPPTRRYVSTTILPLGDEGFRGYLGSPKRNPNQARNPFYESMREVTPGDLVFSFVDTRIVAIGIAASYCCEGPKPGYTQAIKETPTGAASK